jgi:hypothetical protein
MSLNQAARAALRAQLEDAASSVVTLIEQLVDRRIRERARVAGDKVSIEPDARGTIGYEALRRNVRDAIVELMRRVFAIARSPGANQTDQHGESKSP